MERMTVERIKEMLFEIGAALDRAKSIAEFEALQAKYRALKNRWNDRTGNAVIFNAITEVAQ